MIESQSRISFLQKLRNLDVRASIRQTFYRCFIECVITFSFMCWFGSLSVRNRKVLFRVVNVCSKVVGGRLANLCDLYACRVVRKARMIASDNSHVRAQHYELLPSGRRFRTPKFRTLRSKNTFICKVYSAPQQL